MAVYYRLNNKPMPEQQGDLDALIQGKLDADSDFQISLEALSDDEKSQRIAEKTQELIKQEFKSLTDKSVKNEELANNYKIRAEKAERGTPKKDPDPKQGDKDLSPKDLYALIDAKVPQADIDEVVKASRLLNKTISETLQDGLVQARLKDLAEQRNTAQATNTSTSARTTPKMTDEQIVQNFHEGKAVDPEALAVARMNLRKKQ